MRQPNIDQCTIVNMMLSKTDYKIDNKIDSNKDFIQT